ncbi:MAG: hypothetical protein AAF702_01180 [Chloroflexota bacterium]
MAVAKVTIDGDSAIVTLSRSILEKLGIKDGEEINVMVEDNTVLLRSISEQERAARIQQATEKVFHKYDRVFAALAEGAK